MLAASKSGGLVPPPTPDPYYPYVTMLLAGNGTNGTQNNTFLDSSTNNSTITRTGSTTQGSFSPYGSNWSNYFNESSDHQVGLNSAYSFTTGSWTYEGYIYLTGTSTGTYYAVCCAGTEIQLFVFNNALELYVGTGFFINGLRTSANSVPVGSWVHFALVRNSANNTYKMYINGVEQASQTSSSSPSASSTNFSIGSYAIGSSNYFNGYISNFRATAAAVYTGTFTPSAVPLTAISGTGLLTCQSNRFIDNSTNAFAITQTGIPSVQRFSPFSPTAAYSTALIGGSGSWNGTSDYLQAAAGAVPAIGTGDFTISGWWYLNELKNYQILLDFRNGVDAVVPYVYATSSGACYWYVDGGAASYQFSSNLKAKQWFYMVISRVSGTTKVFVNGTQVVSYSDSFNYIAGRLSLGINNGGGGFYYYNGYISDFKVVIGTGTTSGTPPTAPATATSGTQALLSMTNGAIFDNAMMNDLETVGNAQISTSIKKFGTGSMAFDGTGDWLTAPNTIDLQLGTGKFTIEGWVYLNAIGSARGFVSKGTSTTGWSLGTNTSNQVVFNYASSTITSTGTLAASTWYFVTVVREGTGTNQTKIYINGTNDGTGTVSTNFNQTNIMYIGADRVGGAALNGYIDDLRITKGYARYTTTFTPPTTALSTL